MKEKEDALQRALRLESKYARLASKYHNLSKKLHNEYMIGNRKEKLEIARVIKDPNGLVGNATKLGLSSGCYFYKGNYLYRMQSGALWDDINQEVNATCSRVSYNHNLEHRESVGKISLINTNGKLLVKIKKEPYPWK